jgi:hypothetical protein
MIVKIITMTSPPAKIMEVISFGDDESFSYYSGFDGMLTVALLLVFIIFYSF